MNQTPALLIQDLTKSYGTRLALDHIDLEVPRGQILGYIGPNGAGKTTTVKILVGMLSEFSGRVEVCGYDVTRDPLEVKRRVGYVPETPVLYDTLTPLEYLSFVGGLHGMDESEVEAKALVMLGALGLAEQVHARMTSFSKGMSQKVLIVSALLHVPELLLLDEPLEGLDVRSSLIVRDVLLELAGGGMTVLYCSHDMAMVERMCDRIVILNQGRIAADGSMEELRAMSAEPSLERILMSLTQAGDQGNDAERFVEAMRAKAGPTGFQG